MSEQVSEFIKLATQAIQDGQAARALELVEQAISLDPNQADAHLLKGIALAQSNQPDAATAAFRQAIHLAPDSAKAYYNLATHQYQQGQRAEALAMSREALRIDPSHAAARNLVALLEQERAEPTPSPGSPYQAAPVAPAPSPYLRTGYEQPAHSIAWVEKLGGTWTLLAWLIVLVSAGTMALSVVLQMPLYQGILENLNNPDAIQRLARESQEAMGGLGVLLQILSWGSILAIFSWMVIDLVDRRGNWLWMIPFVLCTCCGLGWMVMPIYLVAGRKKI